MTSLRRSALIWMTVLLTVVGGLAFVIAYQLARYEASGFLDDQLRQIALNAGDGLAKATVSTAVDDPEDQFVITIWAPSGALLHSVPDTISLPRQPAPGFATIRAAGHKWRVYLASDAHRTVQVGQRLKIREEMAEAAAFQAGVPILVVIPLTWLVVGWALGQMLSRLTTLADQIAKRTVDNREIIPAAGVPTEVLPLVDAMNILSNRLQQALELQKRFVSDAAHELRTPLTALQIQIDNLGSQATDNQSKLVNDLRAGVGRASGLVEQLLRLARAEEITGTAIPESINLSDLITQCVADFVPLAAAKGIDFGLTSAEAVMILGWPADLKMLFDNLIDNAIRYTPEGGSVDVSLTRRGDTFAIEVIDTGCGVDEADIPRLFDRFVRAAPVDIEGNGLGLAIAAAVAVRHRLMIEIQNRGDCRGLRVLVFPHPHSPLSFGP